jgi:hypothetical protein
MQTGDTGGPTEPEPDKVQQIADDAVAAGKRLLETDTGKKVAEIADTGFAKAEKLLDDVLDNPTGQRMKDGTDDLLAKGGPFLQSALGRNLAIGAGAGAVAGLLLPFVGTIFGAVAGAGLGYLRTISKKS